MKKWISILALILMVQIALAQPDRASNGIRISLVTGSAGQELYSVFGHSAIRVQDSIAGTDILYNYGTFDFNTPNFYWKFIRGKLPYALSVERTEDLKRLYRYENRALTDQTLNLTDAQERELIEFLRWNAQPENRFYLYDFFYDNCATVIRDIFENQYAIRYENKPERDVTFRELLDEKLVNSPWSDFGIDLILGAPADKIADFRNQMFLPDYLAQNLAHASLDDKPLMQPPVTIQERDESQIKQAGLNFTPMMLFVIVALIGIAITLSSNERAKDTFDIIIFGSFGLAGWFFVFMWFGTDHIATKENWNLLWLNPLYLILVFGIIAKKGKWLRVAFAINATILWLTLLGWNFIPQQFHTAVIPILIMLIARSMDREGVVLDAILEKFKTRKTQTSN